MKWEGEEGMSHCAGQNLRRILNSADSLMPAANYTFSIPNIERKREEISG